MLFRRGRSNKNELNSDKIVSIAKSILPDNLSSLSVSPEIGSNGIVTIFVTIPPELSAAELKPHINKYCKQLEAEIRQLKGVKSVLAISKNPQPSAGGGASNASSSGVGDKGSTTKFNQKKIPRVKSAISVAAGKGGVGKSTVSLAFALALSKQGYRVGVLDADFYGPSLPVLLPEAPPPTIDDKNKLIPSHYLGIYLMSIGFLLKDSAPLVWRGPMLMKTLRQLINEVEYPDLDVLVIDMPPGTGDIALTLSQEVHIDGTVIVTTSENMAIADAERCAAMVEKFSIPVLGWVENMAWIKCPCCEKKIQLFNEKNINDFRTKNHIPVIAHLPFDTRTHVSKNSASGLSQFLSEKSDFRDEVEKLSNNIVNSLNLTPSNE